MSEIKRLTLGKDNYPKAGRVRRGKPVRRKSSTKTKTAIRRSAPQDTFQKGHHDSNVDQMNQLRRQAGAKRAPSLGDTPSYPKARLKVDAGESKAGAKPKVHSAPPTSHAALAEIQMSPTYPTAPKNGNSGFKPKYKLENTVADAYRVKFDADMEAQLQQRKAPTVEAAEVKATPKVKKSRFTGNQKTAASGTLSILSGGLSLKNGGENIAKGNYLEGGLQVAQGGVTVADGVNDLNIAHKGFSAADPTKLTKGLKIAGSVMNAGMALYDTKQAYDAIRNGNEVKAADEASSAIINAVSAFPPTAVIGAVGGLVDWGMAASGADDAMIRALTSGRDKAYKKRVEQDMSLARMLVKTPLSRLTRCTRAEKQKYIRGIQGLKEYRRQFEAQGNTKAVRDIDANIARIKGAWTK